MTEHVRIDSHLDLGSKETLIIQYCSQNMQKIVERMKIAYTQDVNNIYYYDYPAYNYVWIRYILQ